MNLLKTWSVIVATYAVLFLPSQ